MSKALYGLQSSPADWSAYRDAEMPNWSWMGPDGLYYLQQTVEGNLWKIRREGCASSPKALLSLLRSQIV